MCTWLKGHQLQLRRAFQLSFYKWHFANVCEALSVTQWLYSLHTTNFLMVVVSSFSVIAGWSSAVMDGPGIQLNQLACLPLH